MGEIGAPNDPKPQPEIWTVVKPEQAKAFEGLLGAEASNSSSRPPASMLTLSV